MVMHRTASLVSRSAAAPLRRAGSFSSLLLLALAGACAHVTPAPGRAAAAASTPAPTEPSLDEADQVLWVRMPRAGAGTAVVLSGARMRLLTGARPQHGDTLFASAPFAVALPDEAFELEITTRGPARLPDPIARLEYTTAGTGGEMEKVEAEGTRLMLRRAAAGEPLILRGATQRTVTVRQRPAPRAAN
jgi:hypothetical protein